MPNKDSESWLPHPFSRIPHLLPPFLYLTNMNLPQKAQLSCNPVNKAFHCPQKELDSGSPGYLHDLSTSRCVVHIGLPSVADREHSEVFVVLG